MHPQLWHFHICTHMTLTFNLWPWKPFQQCPRTLRIFVASSVVTVSLFQGRSTSIGVSMKKSVVGSSLGVYTCSPMPLYSFYDIQFGTVGLIGERVVCVCGAYCRAGAVVNWSQSVHASCVMRNPSVNNETFSQLDVHSTENTHISLLQIL